MMRNAHSLRNKYNEFVSFLESHSIDVAFVSETWLESKDNFSVSNFTIYRADRSHGGVALLVKSSLLYSSYSRINFDYAEAVSITLILNNGSVNITSLYISPAASRQQSNVFFDKVLNRPGSHLVAGDWNWNHSHFSHKGIDLYNLIDLIDLTEATCLLLTLL